MKFVNGNSVLLQQNSSDESFFTSFRMTQSEGLGMIIMAIFLFV